VCRIAPATSSGTTLIAAKRHARACYGLVVDPLYCDVILARWERSSGRHSGRRGGRWPLRPGVGARVTLATHGPGYSLPGIVHVGATVYTVPWQEILRPSRRRDVAEAPTEETILHAAGEALANGAWSEAYVLLLKGDQARLLVQPGAITMLAESAYLAGDIEAAIQAFERVHKASLANGDKDTAAAVAGQIAFMHFDAVMYAPSRAWLRRAERLIEDRPESPARAATTNLRAWHALVEGDIDATVALAREAVDLAERTADHDVAAIARVAEGRALIAGGNLGEGLAILDEASVSAASGELSPAATGIVYCQATCAFQSVSDYERAEQWTRAMERWSQTAGLTTFQGRCRVHRAQLKRLHGDWRDAAAEAAKASDELGRVVPAERGWALTELGGIRLRMGDLAGAEEAFLEAHGLGWEPEPGLSLLRLAEGNVAASQGSIREALDRAETIASREVPPHGALRRAPLLAAQVEIAIAGRDLGTAGAAAAELETIAATYGTPALRATAFGARGAVELASGDHVTALRDLQSALGSWQTLDAPYEGARTRLAIAEASRAAGNEERATLEHRAALAALERLEARASAGVPAFDPSANVPSPTRRDMTFVFTDIVDSTGLIAAIGDEAWQHVLRWHDQALAALIAQHGGTVVNRAGDGFFATFERGSEAVEAAVGIQRALLEHRRTAGFAPRVRVGIHAAQADTDGSSWTGIGVHAAARIGALAEADEIVASRTTATGAGLGYPLTEPRTVTLKGIREPMEVVSIGWQS
jgi:class 3 adenylate cyclase